LPKNEDGEFELILGNSQLLSVFFIVVVLIAVFFMMGYIVGRNSSPPGALDVAATRKPEPKPLVVDTPREETKPAPAETSSAPPRQTATQQAPPIERPKPPEPKPERRATAAPAADQPAAGQSYLQLAATGKHEADVMVDVLRKKSFSAMTAEITEKPGTFRVLVGPIPDGGIGKMRADLESLGFPGNKGIKRIF